MNRLLACRVAAVVAFVATAAASAATLDLETYLAQVRVSNPAIQACRFRPLVYVLPPNPRGSLPPEAGMIRSSLLSHIRLFAVVAVSFALQPVIHHLAIFETLFGTEPISTLQGIAGIAPGSIPLLTLELIKFVRQQWRLRVSVIAPITEGH